MSEDNYTEITSESWFSRISNSIKGIIGGVVLIIGSIFLLFWNEGRTVKRYKALNEGAGSVVSVSADKVDTSNDGKLIHISGTTKTYGALKDPMFQVSGEYIRLKREVEMYQWQEDSESKTEKKLGGGTETVTKYNYKKVWSSSVISSSDFKESKYQNPGAFPVKEESWDSNKVTIGAYELSDSQISSFSKFKVLSLDNLKLPEQYEDKYVVSSDEYITSNITGAEPKVGDVRIKFSYVKAGGVASIVAKQVKNTFEPYVAKNGERISLLEESQVSAENMFANAQSSNSAIKWLLRVVGIGLMFFGMTLVFSPLEVLADIVPFIGDIVGMGVSLLSLLLTTILSSLTISIAWIFYRPILGVSLILISIVAIVFLKMKMGKKEAL